MSPPKASSPLALPPQSGSDDRAHAFPLGTRPAAARQDSSGPSAGRSLIPQKPPTGPRMKTPPTPGSATFYAAGPAESSEQLLAPSRNRAHRFRDDDHAGLPSPAFSGYSSRRTSWSSDQGSRDSRIYGANPFADSRAPSRAGSDDENLNTQTVSEKYNILPSAGLLLFPEDVEKDDYLHNPDPNDKDRDCDLFTRRGFVNMGGLLLITMGVLMLFVGYPVL